MSKTDYTQGFKDGASGMLDRLEKDFIDLGRQGPETRIITEAAVLLIAKRREMTEAAAAAI